ARRVRRESAPALSRGLPASCTPLGVGPVAEPSVPRGACLPWKRRRDCGVTRRPGGGPGPGERRTRRRGGRDSRQQHFGKILTVLFHTVAIAGGKQPQIKPSPE
ncbi:unnamed protein product, partial [Gulo gulo]